MKRTLFCAFSFWLSANAQQNITGVINKPAEKPVIAVPDFRGSGDAQRFMPTFNSALFGDLQNSGQLKMAAKTFYPLQVPQQPADFRQSAAGQGLWLTDWSGPPVNANYLAFGY